MTFRSLDSTVARANVLNTLMDVHYTSQRKYRSGRTTSSRDKPKCINQSRYNSLFALRHLVWALKECVRDVDLGKC